MKAIDFVVRDSAGGLQRGVVSADSNAHVIQAQSGQEISLNLRQTDLQGQVRAGNDLVITLTDGRVITIDNYFNDGGAANRLFISSDGYLNEVAFLDTGDGQLYAQFGPTEQWGKWSPSDDLIYLGRTEVAEAVVGDEEVSMFAGGPLTGGLFGGGAIAAGLGGAAVVGGIGGGGGGGGTTTAAPFVDDADSQTDIGGDDSAPHVITVTGGGEPGDEVTVTIGDRTVETVIDENGVFEAVFEGDNFPGDGVYETVVVVATAGGDVELDGPGYHIDTTPPEVEITAGAETLGDFFNLEAFEDGVTLSGTGEAGATLEITIQGVTRTTTVSEDGTWSATWQSGTLDVGEYSTGVTIVASDAFGNTTTISDSVYIDTLTFVSIDTGNIEFDGVINHAESEDGVTLTGSAQPGSTVVVSFGTGTHEATVSADGTWSVDFPMSEIPTGEITSTITAVATDAYGNSATSTGEVDIDTLVRDFSFTGSTGGADGVVNIAEAVSGVTMTGTTEPGSTVNVTMNGHTHAATVAADGTWTVHFPAGELPAGETTAVMTAVATDAAGNTSSISRDVDFDLDAGILTISSTPVEGDDIVNEVEASDGVTITGTSNPGAVVTVTLAGASHNVVTDGAGNWTANFAAHEVTAGVYTADITARTVDAAGNPLEASDSVEVDTRVDNLTIDTGAVGGTDGVINAAERLAGGGMLLTGTTEVGSTSVVVDLNGQAVNATVEAAGNWTAVFSAGQVAEGTYNATATVTATDRAGNVASTSGTVRVDTEVVPFAMTNGGGGADSVGSAAEVAAGIDLGGQVETGSTVVVTFDGIAHAANVDGAGNWSLTIPPAAIRGGTYDAAISVTATDVAGNSETITDTLAIDTDAPEGPVIASYTRDGDGIRGISTEMNADDLAVHQVHANGTVTEVASNQVDIPVLGESNFQFDSQVPDGSHLVITATDDAGNMSGTYVVLDDEVATTGVTLDAGSLGHLNIETLDLDFAEEGNLTITEDTLLALSSNTNELKIDGGTDDTVNIEGAVRQGSTSRDGQTYDIYTLGEEGTLFIDNDINVVI